MGGRPPCFLAASVLAHLLVPCTSFSVSVLFARHPTPALPAGWRPFTACKAASLRLRASPQSASNRQAIAQSVATRLLCQQTPSLGQDLKELFDVYVAPPDPITFSGEPVPAGFSKQRTKVHRDGDWHRAVHIWLYNSEGKLVLQQRSEGKDTFPGKWDCSVGGHVTAGDSVMETAIKEVREELGVKAEESDLELLGTIATSIEGSSPAQGAFTCNEYKDVFLMRFDGDVAQLNFGEDEVQDVGLRPWKDVLATLETQVGANGEQLDGEFIPRPRHYLDLLFGAIAAKFP